MYAICISGLLEVFQHQHFERISNIQQVAFLEDNIKQTANS